MLITESISYNTKISEEIALELYSLSLTTHDNAFGRILR